MKTKSTKKITGLLVLLFAFASFGIFAQEDGKKKMCNYLMKNSTYIFEGKIVSRTPFKTSEGLFYNSIIIEIDEVVNGSLKKGTVEMIECTGMIDKDGLAETFQVFDGLTMPDGKAIFFCYDDKSAPNSTSVKTNPQAIKIWDAVPLINNEIKKDPRGGISDYFTNATEFYKYLSNNYSINIDKSVLEKKSPSTTETLINPILKHQKDLAAFEKLNQIRKKRATLHNQTQNRTVSCSEIYISEYLCGQGNNKSVEIYNPTHNPINLANYSLLIYHGASYTPTTIALTGTISALSTHVVSKPNASSAILAHTNQTSNNLNFNGDECIVLNKASIHIDKIGEIGIAIGSGGWTLTPSGSTNNSDLRRMYNIGQGDTSWTNCKTEWNVLVKDSISNLGQHQSACENVPDPNLYFNITNAQTIGTSPQYFQFDVYVSCDNNSTYLEDAFLRFKYNTAAFGNHISANSNVTITNLGLFADTANYSTAIQTDHTSSAVTTAITANYNNNSYYLANLTTTPQPFMRVKIKIANCNQPANILLNLDSLQTSSDFGIASYQTFSDFPTLYTSVDSVSGSGHANNLTCASTGIQITDFTQPIDAGVGSILTITGTGFGISRGNGKVRFKNADDGGATYLTKLNNLDYLNWSNTQIQITLPSFVDDTISVTPLNVSKYFIGGGNFIVTNNAGQSDTSGLSSTTNLPFSIYYSINEGWSYLKDKKLEVDLRNKNGNGGYTLRLNPTDFPPNSNRRAIFARAMRDWTCFTGVNWVIGVDTNIVNYNSHYADGINYISFTSDSLPLTTVARTTLRSAPCSGNTLVLLQEADMQFNSNKTFVEDSTGSQTIPAGQQDFYGTCLHELGHFLQLAHNNDPNNLMFWIGNAGPLSLSQLKRLAYYISPVEGGAYSETQSVSNTISCSGITAMIGQNASCTMGINTYLTNNYFLNLYPNPTTGATVNINFQAPTNTQAQIIVYDMMGRAVYSNNLDNRNEINSTYSLDVSNLSSGMYMVNLVIDKVKVCQKFIKQ